MGAEVARLAASDGVTVAAAGVAAAGKGAAEAAGVAAAGVAAANKGTAEAAGVAAANKGTAEAAGVAAAGAGVAAAGAGVVAASRAGAGFEMKVRCSALRPPVTSIWRRDRLMSLRSFSVKRTAAFSPPPAQGIVS